MQQQQQQQREEEGTLGTCPSRRPRTALAWGRDASSCKTVARSLRRSRGSDRGGFSSTTVTSDTRTWQRLRRFLAWASFVRGRQPPRPKLMANFSLQSKVLGLRGSTTAFPPTKVRLGATRHPFRSRCLLRGEARMEAEPSGAPSCTRTGKARSGSSSPCRGRGASIRESQGWPSQGATLSQQDAETGRREGQPCFPTSRPIGGATRRRS